MKRFGLVTSAVAGSILTVCWLAAVCLAFVIVLWALFAGLPGRDQLRMLEGPDNVVADGGASMQRLGLRDTMRLDEQLRRAATAQAQRPSMVDR